MGFGNSARKFFKSRLQFIFNLSRRTTLHAYRLLDNYIIAANSAPTLAAIATVPGQSFLRSFCGPRSVVICGELHPCNVIPGKPRL